MLLAELADPTTSWLAAERYLGGGTRSYSRYAADLEITDRYHPQRGTRSFEVGTYWIGPAQGEYLTAAGPSTLPSRYRDGDSFLLPVHPETLTLPAVRAQLAGCRPGPPIQVVPTANARTVFVAQFAGQVVPPHFLKLHYPKRLSRFTRRLRRPVIALQLWVADELTRIGAPVLPEVGGGVIGADPAEAWGFLLREARVRHAPDLPYVVPLFALYGNDVRAPRQPTLLEQLIDHSGADAGEWVRDQLIAPMITLWGKSLLTTGCALELHGQNTLLCLSKDLSTTAIAYRDCAVYVDPSIRADLGLSGLPPRNVISRDVDKPRGQVFSLVYDCFMGSHTLAYIARLLAERFGVAPARLHTYARQVFAQQLGEAADWLPPTVHYYDDQLHANGDWRLVDTGAAPQWR